MGAHYLIDETKAKSYVVVAVACPDSALATARRTLGRLVLPGQRSIHMKHESARRSRALHTVVQLALPEPSAALVLDHDQTLVARDARSISDACRAAGTDSITYSHQTLASQPLLALPDVIAWCWARGGDWRRRITPIIAKTMRV